MEVSPGRFWNGDTKWINNCFVLDVSVRFSINRPVRSHFVEEEFEYKPFVQKQATTIGQWSDPLASPPTYQPVLRH